MRTERQEQKNKAWRTWYLANRDVYNKRSTARQHKRIIRTRKWLVDFKRTLRCVRCDFANPAALQFHHRDPTIKSACIADATNVGWSIKRILEEIAKCEVVCANCHND